MPRFAKSAHLEELNTPPPGGDKPPVSIKVNLEQALMAGCQPGSSAHGIPTVPFPPTVVWTSFCFFRYVGILQRGGNGC